MIHILLTVNQLLQANHYTRLKYSATRGLHYGGHAYLYLPVFIHANEQVYTFLSYISSPSDWGFHTSKYLHMLFEIPPSLYLANNIQYHAKSLRDFSLHALSQHNVFDFSQLILDRIC